MAFWGVLDGDRCRVNLVENFGVFFGHLGNGALGRQGLQAIAGKGIPMMQQT